MGVTLGTGRLDEAADPAFEAQTVGDDELGLGQASPVGGSRGIDVPVPVRADEDGEVDAVAPHIGDEVGQDREARHHLDLVRGRLRPRGGGRSAQAENKKR
jgi:hypothetical protein